MASMFTRIYLFSLLTLTSAALQAQEVPLFVQEDLKLVGSDYKFTEGCSKDKAGNVFFTDQPNDKIWKYDVDGKLSVFLDKTGRSNGTYFDKKGNLITCADEKGEIWSVDKRGKVTVLLNNFGGKQLNGPNDIWLDGKGGMYFTDPYYQRPYWTRQSKDIPTEDVYYLAKDAKEAIKVADGLKQPNGIVGSGDGKFLFVSDIADGKTYKYPILKSGVLGEKQLLITRGSDGMTLDNKGNIYLTGNGGVHIFDASGKSLGTIKVPKGASNVCFYGKSNDILFITAHNSVYTIPVNAKGIE
jgi:gluconolactonase